MRHGWLGIVMASALMASAVHADSGWRYYISSIEVIDLGTMGGRESVANDINDSGEIVGWSHLPDGAQHGFLWRKGGMEDITPFPGYTSEARGINNSTRVVGSLIPPKDDTLHAFYWDSRSAVVRLDEAYTGKDAGSPDCATGSSAKAINDDGVIAGIRLGGCNPPRAFISRAARWPTWWSPWEEIVPLGHAPKPNYAYNINAEGRIVGADPWGYSWTGAFHWSGYSDDVPFPSVPGSAFAEPSSMRAYGINAGNAIVGSLTLRDSPYPGESIKRAFFWNGHSAEGSLLPPLTEVGESAAHEINKDFFTVGYSDNRDRWAVIWHSHFGVKWLPTPPGAGSGTVFITHYCEALAVNNRDENGLVQAVGFCDIGGNRHATLWNIKIGKSDIVGPTP